MTYPEPFDEDEDAFIIGPEGGRLDVDAIFAKDFDRVMEEFRREAPAEIEADMTEQGLPSLLAPELTYRDVPAGLMLFHGDRPVGGYLSCDLSLSEEYQGRGLGAELVIERCLRDGCSPVWPLDAAAYSPAGLGVHRAAWRHVRSHPVETRIRVERLEGGSR